jgi:arginyl-tRNA synthetase
MDIKTTIKNLIKEALDDLGIEAGDILLDHPTELGHGDYSTNIAMSLAKALKSSPKDLAEKVASKIDKHEYIESVNVAGAGFINFHLSRKFFEGYVLDIDFEFGKTDIHDGKTILVEHSSPNLFKPFHVGHVMNNTIGESIARLAEYSGANIIKVSYPSDVSLGIGKSVWALLEHGVAELEEKYSLSEKLAFLGECYVEGTKAYEENPTIMRRVKDITDIIYKKTPSPEYDAYLLGKDITLKYFQDITERLGSTFNEYIFESEAGDVGKKLVLENMGDIFEESEGAIVYKGEADGLHTRVFINQEGYPTYEAKDIGLLWLKFERYSPDISILVTDREQKNYYEVVLSAAGKIEKSWQERTIHKTHGRMSFKGQKMSSRLGGVPIAADILDTVSEELKGRMKEESDAEKLDSIAISALKFTILKTMAGKDINFDPETSLSFEGDSGPYLQYTNARINSVLEKARDLDIKKGSDEERLTTDVEKLLYRFPEVVELSVNEWAPHHIAGYLILLAQSFNSWYGNTKLIDEENPNMAYNLLIAKAVSQTIQNGLYLLGIKSPERM